MARSSFLRNNGRGRQIVGGRYIPLTLFGDQGVIAWMIVDVGDQRVEAHAPENLGASFEGLATMRRISSANRNICPALALVFVGLQKRQAADHARARISLLGLEAVEIGAPEEILASHLNGAAFGGANVAFLREQSIACSTFG